VVVEDGTHVCDDAVRLSVAMHDLIHEVEYSANLWASDWLDFDPLGELVDSHQDSIESSFVVGRGPIMSSPQQAKGQVGGMVTSS
jgi:hypothetical protein